MVLSTIGMVAMGRRAYNMAEGDLTGYEYQVPIFVLTHHVPEQIAKGQNENREVFFVTDGIKSAVEKAKAAAGTKYVTVVGGANTAQQLVCAGLVDEIQVGIMPVLFGKGLRFFEHLGIEPMQLERIDVKQTSTRTDLRFRIIKK